MLRKAFVFAILIALALASFPTSGVLAKDAKLGKLETKWEQLVDRYNVQTINHDSVHKMTTNWLKTAKNPSASEKAEVYKHLAICNSALAAAQQIVSNHAGFDRSGKVIDRALANTSIKQLANYLQQHANSVKHLKIHTKQ